MNITKARANYVIDKLFCQLPDMHHGFCDLAMLLRDECADSERQHRKGHPAPRNFSVERAARYFVVQWLHQYTTKSEKLPEVADYLSIRRECFLAAAIAIKFSDKLSQWITHPDFADFAQIDYVDMME